MCRLPIASSHHLLSSGSMLRVLSPPQRRILVDLKHPADVHLFRNVILLLQDRGHQVRIVCRETPTTVALLEHAGLCYEAISKKRTGVPGLAWELLSRDLRLLGIVLEFQPHVLVARHGVAISHVGFLTRTTSISFEDTEHARLQIMLSWLFLSRIYTEQHYLRTAGRRQRRYNSLNALAYLHPNHFTPDPAVLAEVGLGQDEPFVLVRFVAWDAAHDLAQRRDRSEERRWLVRELSKVARVLVVPEGPLPADFDPYIPRLPAHRFHDLLAFASAYVGEGGAVAEEAAVLGVPTIYTNPLKVGFVLELARFGLCIWETNIPAAAALAIHWLRHGERTRETFRRRRERLLAEKIDPVPFIVSELLAAANGQESSWR